MACGGCRRNKKTSGSRVKTQVAVPKKAVIASVSSDIVANRKKKCYRCPFNTATGLSGRCKKTNRVISRAINDPNFKCPIKRF